MTASRTSPATARQQLTDHRHYRYRGCAPHPDRPDRAAGNPALPIGAWAGPDVDGAENQKARRAREAAAIEVCIECPVMTLCLDYARTYRIETGADGKEKAVLAEPYGVWGATTALERHKEFIAERHRIVAPAPDGRFHTPQKQALLAALAAHTLPAAVAAAAGMDVRTANWHRSTLAGLLGLDKKTATRRQLLAAAVARGLLDVDLVVDDDGTVPAVAVAHRTRTPAATQATRHPTPAHPSPARPTPARPGRLRLLRAPRTHAVDGQLEFDLDLDTPAGASVHTLPRPRLLGAAA